MLNSIDNLRQIKQRCIAGEPLDMNQAQWLGTALSRFLDHRCTSMDDALGLRFAQGGMPWWRAEANRERDAALRDVAETYMAGQSKSAQAKQIARMSLRYAASAWRLDRVSEDMPSHYEDTIKQPLWLAFKSGATMPIGERQLRNILVG